MGKFRQKSVWLYFAMMPWQCCQNNLAVSSTLIPFVSIPFFQIVRNERRKLGSSLIFRIPIVPVFDKRDLREALSGGRGHGVMIPLLSLNV
jgi:hypothetical protein